MWIPKKKVRAVLQIAHGMVEHIKRYEQFAAYLNEYGIAVIGHDHLGHVYTAKTEKDQFAVFEDLKNWLEHQIEERGIKE